MPKFSLNDDGFRERMRKNPYDSPRVVKAVLEEIIERVSIECYRYRFDVEFQKQLQYLADVLASCVVWKGVELRKLLSIDCHPDVTDLAGKVNFVIRPLCEDGRWLCEQMKLLEPPEVELPKATIKPKVEKLTITRIVEI